MEIVILLITIYVFIKTLIYGIIEIKQEHNIKNIIIDGIIYSKNKFIQTYQKNIDFSL